MGVWYSWEHTSFASLNPRFEPVYLHQMKCKHCHLELEKFRYSTKYCSNACQNAAQIDLKKKALLDGEYIGRHLQFRGWARTVIEEIKGNKCVCCGIIDTYFGEPITLQVDHIDGIATNNQVNNLRLLCPNCHSQTPTYGAKNKGRSTRVSRRSNAAVAELVDAQA